MIKIKHFMDAVEPDDGARLWVEPFGLTRDLRQWCAVGAVLPHLGPPLELWKWFDAHPQAYELFRGCYHEYLSDGRMKAALRQLAKAAASHNFTLLHQGSDPEHNTATAFYEFLSELEAWCSPEP
jgi:uncharacterized protein YeaO (DUF488 family)